MYTSNALIHKQNQQEKTHAGMRTVLQNLENWEGRIAFLRLSSSGLDWQSPESLRGPRKPPTHFYELTT